MVIEKIKEENDNQEEIKNKGLLMFSELMQEVSVLPNVQQEKVCIFVQGLIAGCGKENYRLGK